MGASQYIVMDKDGNPWGPFSGAAVAAAWAAKKWPDQEEAVEVGPDDWWSVGWQVTYLRPPQ